jgi:hypothetical protein
VSSVLTYASGGNRCTDCPKCGQAVRVDVVRGGLKLTCYGGCLEEEIAPLVDQDEILDELEHRTNGAGSKRPEDRLTKLLALHRVDKCIARPPRVVGTGRAAVVYLYVTDTDGLAEQEIVFDRLADMAKPQTLLTELAACTGARPKLDQAKCLDVIALICEMAEHELTTTIDAQSREWGMRFLQSAQEIEVGFTDQAARWAAFSEWLEPRNPWATAREQGTTVAAASVILRHVGGTRYVRADWFRSYVRSDDPISPQEIRSRMCRVGWTHPGTEGRVKATRPGFPKTVTYAFWTVPPGWEDSCEVAE